MITVIATAPLINLALGAPTGNPALGALGALSRYGGSRTSGSTNGNLDTIHPPEIPDLTIPQVEKPNDAEKPSGTEKTEATEKPVTDHTKNTLDTPQTHVAPPPYTPAAGQPELRQDKSPAYTTSPHALGTLHITAAVNGAAPATLSPLSDAASQTAPAAGATPERGNRGTATPDTLAPEVGHGSPDGITSVVAGAPPGHRLLTPDTAVVSETRPDTSNPARSTSPDTTSSRVQADRTAAPLSTTAGLSPALPAARPDTTGGHLAATARAADTLLPDSTRSFLAETAPATTRPPAMPDTLHAPALTDPAPSASMPEPSAITTARPHDVPASFPIEPVRAIPLPGNGGVAFVPDGYTTNITNAFPHPEPGVFRVVVQHRDNTFALPGHHTLDPAHRPERLIAALQDLPTQLAAWSNYTKIDLLACDLTPTLLDRLTPAIHATFGVELHAPYRQTPLFVAPTGGLSLTDPGIPHTLHLAPKRRRSDTMVADPKAPETSARLAEVSARLLHQYGNISARWLSYSIPRETFPQKLFDKQFNLHLKQEREKQANSGTLWSPLYRGKSNFENFSKDKLNDFTAWIYRKAVADQTSNPAAIAKTAAEAGFAVGETKLANAVNAATEAAAIDGRRHPSLTLGKPEHRVRIIALLDRILANTDRRTQTQTLTSLNDVNVHGSSNLLRALITEREQALKDDPALAEAARRLGLPALRPSGAFLGRFLDVAKAADRGWIEKLAYAAAWEHKSATADELTRLLLDEGIAGDPGVLREIVTTVIGEATRQGDRLPLLDATDQGQHAAIHARTAAIVNVTPALYTSTGPALVTHMRTRHITGPQHDLETIAQTILETPAEELTQDYSLAPLDLDDLPSAARAIGVEEDLTDYGPDISPAEEALASTAKQLLLDFGDLNIRYLVTKWPNPNRQSKLAFTEMSEHLTTERTNLKTSGELWLPTYRGLRNSGKDSHTDDLTAWLYRQVIADHTNSPTAIAYDAAAAGFTTGHNQLVQETRAAMEAATNDGRRHVYLTITKPEHRDRIIALIDRILANAPSPTRNKVIDLLHEVNGHGDDKVLQVLVSERRQALQDDPALAEAARQLGLPTLRPTGTYQGRFLDVANEADHSWIGSPAYAAAWEHKTATIQQLVTLLTQEGIRDTNGGLTPLIARILAEADANGDRHTTLSTHRPGDHTAILRRTGSLVLKNHDKLFALEPARAITRLVRHMRRNNITGTQDTLRDIAHTVYTLPTHQPLPGTHTIPLPTHDGLTVTAIPLPGNGGIAFIPAAYATNITNAFPHPEPGVFRLITQHRHGVFALPAHPHAIPHRPDQLVRTLHQLPPALANWGDHTTIALLACDLTPTHSRDLADLIHTNLGLQLTIPHTETPLYITPDGIITTTDPGLDNTLHLAPPDTPTQTTLTTTSAWRRTPGTNETFKQFLLDNNHATTTDLSPDKTGKLPPRSLALVKNWAIAIGAENLSSADTAEQSGGLVSSNSVRRWRRQALREAGGVVLPDADTLTTTGAWRRTPGTTETFKQFLLDNNHATTTDLTPNKKGDLSPWGSALVKNWAIATGAERLSAPDTAEQSGGLVSPSSVKQWRKQALLAAGGTALPDTDTLTTTGAWRRTPGTTETLKQFLLDNNHATTTDLTPDKTGKLPPRGQALVKNWAIATSAERLSAPDTAEQSGGLASPRSVNQWRKQALLAADGTALPDTDTLTTTSAWRRTPGTTETLKQFLLDNNHATTTDLTPNSNNELPPRGHALVKNWVLATGAGDRRLNLTEAAEHSGGLVKPSTVSRWRVGARAHAEPAATTAQGDVSQLELRPTKRRKTESSASRPEFVVPADIREFVVGFDPETNRTQPSLWAMLEHFQATFLPELDLSRDSRGLPTSTTTRNLVRDWATDRAASYPADWIAKMSGWSITTTQAEGLSARMVTQPSPHSAVPAGPSPSPSIATFSPLGPVRVIPLPEGGGAAFVSDAFATNVLNAFPHPEPGVFTLVVHHQNGYFPLPGEGARPVPHQAAQLVETLKHLPSRLVGWHNYREIELFACNLADGHADQLAAIARSALDIELTSARPGRFISITRAGDIVATIDQPTGLPPGTLTLGGGKRGQPTDSETGAKRPRIDEDPNHGFSPEQAELLRSTFTERHITGPQEALKAQALVLLRIPLESLLADPTTQPDAPFGPITLHADEGAATSGRGAPRAETTRFDDVDEVTAVLWLVSIDHPRETAAQIARRAEEAGLTGHPDLVERAGSVIDIAVRHQRRHPFLDVDVSSDRLALQTVIGALFITEPGATIDSVMARLPSYNITGDMSKLRALLAARKSDLARTAKRTPEIYQEIVRSSRTILRPEPERPFAGRSPDTDRPLIENLAYAAFMVNREATTEEVVARLVEEGIVGDPVVLTEVVVQAAAEAARRHAPAPALPVVSNALHQRIGEILLSDPELRDPENPDGMTGLVKALRERDIATPEDVLRDHTQTVLAIRSDVPLPGGFSIPVPSPAGRPVRAMPFPGGVAFVRDVFAQNIFNAFPQPEAGTLRVVVPREHRRGGAFVLPGFLPDTDLRHDPAQFAEVLANLPASIAAGGSIGTIALFSCRVTPESGTNLTRLIRQRTGWQHLNLTVAHPDKPVAFTPTGGIRLADNGKHPVSTLILGPEPATVSAVRGEIDGSVYHRYIDSGGVVRAVAFWHKEQAETLAQTMQGRDLAAQLGHPGSRVIFTHHVRDRFLISREEDRLRRASATIMFRIFDALVQDGVLPWRQENLLLASCEVSQAEADQFRELARDNGYTGDLRVITDQIVEIDPDADASLLPTKASGTGSRGDGSSRAIRFGFVEGDEAESSAVSHDTAVPALPSADTPPFDVVSWQPGANRTLRDYLVGQVAWPATSHLARLPLEIQAMVQAQFELDPAPASHLNAWVEAQFPSRPAGYRQPTFAQVANLSGGLVSGREIAGILARKVVDAHGSLTPAAVRLQLTTEGIRHPELNTAITEALARAEAEGSAWHPTYRGDRRPGVFDPDEPGPATLLLWRLAVDHPRDTAAGLAHRAEQAGLLGGEDLVRNAELAVDSAVHDQRRVLSAAKPSDHPRIHSLIDALLVTEPGLDTPAVVDRLRGYSVHEGLRGLHPMVESRLGLPAMDIEAARALLVPRPAGAILGRVLDSADAGNREIIGHLAYATAWTHKTDTVEQLAARLRRDGVTGPEPDLLRVITETVAEADLHGDRLESLPADRPAYHHLLRLRVEQILADTPSLRDSRSPERLTQLVRQMRLHKVTGPQYLLTAHAHSALTRPATTPLGSGATTVGAGFPGPIRTLRATPGTRYQHIVDADGTITGVGFLPENEAPILRAAAARHDLATQLGHPGARLVFAHHDHTGYTIPHPTDGAGLFDALSGLGAAWKHHDILLVTCLPDPTHTEQFRAAARTHGYQGTVHTTTSPHTEITEHHGARPLHPGDTPHPDAIILNPTSQTVTFAKGARDLMAGDWFNADHPAQRVIQLGESLYDGLLNAYESRGELPEIEVHGYGNSRRPGRAMATSVARADSVVAALLFGLNVAHQNRPAADRIPDFDLVPQAMLAITHGRAGSPFSSGRDLEERRRGVFVRIPALPLPAGRVPTFTYRNPSGVDLSGLEPLRFGSPDNPIRLPREFLVPPGPALAMESPSGAMIFPSVLFGMASGWSEIRKYPGVISLWLDVDHRSGEVFLRDGIRLSYHDFATWVHEMLNGAPDSQRLLLLADHGGEQPGRAGNQPGVPASSLAGILSAATHGRVLTPLTGTIWTYGDEEHYATNWGLFQDGTLLGVYERHETWRRAGISVADAVAATRLEYPRHPETAQDVNGLVAEREATAAAAAEAYINPPPPLPSASKPVKLPERTRIKFSPDSHRIELRYRNELERLFRQVYLHAQEAYDEAEAFPQVIITGLEENTSESKQLRKNRAQTVKDLAVQWMAKELEERTARRESTFDAGSPEESRSFLESFIRLGSRTYDGDPTHEVVIELFNLREIPEEVAGASSADHAPAPSTLYQRIIDADGTITGVGFLPENEAPTLHNAAARHDLATQLGHPGARLVFAHHDHTGYTTPHPTDPATFFHTLDTTLTRLGATWKHHDILLVTCLPSPTHTEQIRTTAQELGYQGTIHTTTSPHTEITEHHGARPLHPDDTPHPDAIILNPTSQTIRFPQGTRSTLGRAIDYTVLQRLYDLGAALYSPLVNAQRAGAPLPRIEITGYGNALNIAQATATGLERAESVRWRILTGLRREHENRESGTASTDPGQLARAIVATSGGRAQSPKSVGGTLTERRRSAFVEVPAFPQAPARVPTFTYQAPPGVDSSRLGPLRFSPPLDPGRMTELGFLVPEGPALAMESPGGAMIFPPRTDVLGTGWETLRPFHGVLAIWAQPNLHGEVLLRDGNRVSYRDFATWVRDMAPGSHRVLLLSDRAGAQPGQRPSQPVRPELSLAAILSETLGGSVLAPIDQLLHEGRTFFSLRWGLFRDGELVGVHARAPVEWRHEFGHTDAVQYSGLAAPPAPWQPLTAAQNAARAAMAEERSAMAAEAATAYLASPAVAPATSAAPDPSVLDAHVAPSGAAYARPPVPGAEPIALPWKVEVSFPTGSNVLRDGNQHLENLFRHIYVRSLQVAANAGFDYPHVFITGLFDSPATGTSHASARAKTRAEALKARAVEWFSREEDARRSRRQERFGPDTEISIVAEHLLRVGESRARTGGQSHDVVIEIMYTATDDENQAP
ncbi:hypothetical protein [Amycolatopsis sp. WAC 04169]|uniref:hypothetical protein n=1 Tax=Amycolatopsis sp. WAC 04169 TaxID=2203197 RepID=UPI001F260B1D|nr:hypothetical protein [Amycolatopsis sp. WAC 04169]